MSECNGKFWIVLNPTAGKGKALKRLPGIERFMRGSGRDFEVILTKGPGDALELVRNLPLAPGDVTVAAGGDGTCNEVANGLLSSRPADPPLFGILPVGRGNDFSSTPGIPEDVEKALRILLAGKTRPLDAGLVTGGFFPDGRYFVNGVGIGFDAKVGFAAARMKIKSGLSYALCALAAVARFEPSPVVRVVFDGNELTIPATLVSIVNGRRMGGSFYMGPNAVLDDGLLDLCAVQHQAGRLKLMKVFSAYTKGTQSECEGVHFGRSARFRLEAIEGGMAAHCDGETVCYDGRELEISCVPGALRLVGAS
ncbi:MAG: diacylglycerol kinase family lipid kinase [Treponema sp.]|nr:diacylglycerol kinase family lipid kinase [Treponema sp.]